MDWNPQTVEFLSQSFVDTLSTQPEIRRRAEENLSDAADTPNYGLAVLRLVAESSVDEQIRQCAAVDFKKHLKTRWVPLPFSATPIPDGEKDQIKTVIVPLMLSATGKIQAELSEAIAVIGNSDFPKFWTDLLPDLKSSLEKAINADEFASANSILATVNSLFERFRCERSHLYKKLRYAFESNSTRLDLEYCSDNFAAPLLSTVESISRKIIAFKCVSATLRQLLEAQRLCCMIFYSLSCLCVPEEFEEKEDEWMNEFKNCLTERYPAAIEDADCLSLVDEVRAAVCENISHYMEKKKELLQKHLSDFVEAVWSLVVAASASSERLTFSGLKFLTIVSDHGLFVSDDEIFQRIVIPNVMLRDEDEALFEENYLEFIRRDMEWNDHLNTTRRIACELLLKGSTKNKEKIRAQIHKLLAVCDENPGGNWKYKECAIWLVVSLATGSGASVSTDLVDVESFFRSVIVPELQEEEDVNAFPMLKAAALKFFTVFRVLIPKHAVMPLVCDLVRYVGSDVEVVHSYAAICIEKLLLVKDNHNIIINGEGGVELQARYTSTDIHSIHEELIYKLLDALAYSEENHYIMRCLMRVVEIADISLWMPSTCITGLIKALNEVLAGNPKNTPMYNHFLFEAIATLVRRGCEKDPGSVTGLRKDIVPITKMIVGGEVKELYPYAFQLLAQLVDLNRPPIPFPIAYMQKFDDIVVGHDLILWKKEEYASNVPALSRLLRSYLQQVPDEVNKEGRLRCVVVGIIDRLVSSPTTEEEGFRLLNTVIETYEYGVIAEYMRQIWPSLFARLQENQNSSKTPSPRLVRCVIVFMSLFLVKHGVQTLVDLINSISVKEGNLFHVILREFWIPNLKIIGSGYGYKYTEVKVIAVASTKLLCESALLLDPSAEEVWGKLLDAIVTLLLSQRVEEERERVVEGDDDDVPDLTGYLLKNVGGRKEEEDWDPLKEFGIKDPKQFLVGFPAKVSSQFHGRFPLSVMRPLSPHNQAALVKLCTSYNVAIV